MLLKYYDSAFFNRSIIISDINLVAIYKIFLIRNDGLRMKVTIHKNHFNYINVTVIEIKRY